MERIFYYIALVSVFVFLVISKTFSPAWLLILVIFILWPQRRDDNIRPLFIVSIFLFLIYIVIHYFSVLTPFIFGACIAYIIAPIVDVLEKKRVPRFLAILIILLPLIAIVPLVIFLLAINLINELKFLIEKIPEIISRSRLFIDVLSEKLNAIGIYIDQEIIINTVSTYLGTIVTNLLKTIVQVGQGIRGLLVFIYNFILIPIIVYLLLADRKKIVLWIEHLLPENEQDKFKSFVNKINISFAKYFRGAIILMILVGFIIGFMLWLLGVRYYVFLGVVAGICNLIPNIGFVLSLVIALFVGIFTPPLLTTILKIFLVYIGEQLLENFFLGPIIIGKASRLNPAIVILSLVLGSAIAGFWGLIFAIPVLIFSREFLNHFLNLSL